jgi:Zinc finger, C3HC4 type (RING finger)
VGEESWTWQCDNFPSTADLIAEICKIYRFRPKRSTSDILVRAIEAALRLSSEMEKRRSSSCSHGTVKLSRPGTFSTASIISPSLRQRVASSLFNLAPRWVHRLASENSDLSSVKSVHGFRNDTLCPLCLRDFGDRATELECKHKFHPECIKAVLLV